MVQTLINKQEVTIRSFSTTTKSVQYEDQQSMASGRRDFFVLPHTIQNPFSWQYSGTHRTNYHDYVSTEKKRCEVGST